MDFGNHLTVKQEVYRFVKDIFKEKDNCEVTFGWTSMLDEADFSTKIPELMTAFNEQNKFDEHLASVLEEFSGVRMYWFELK